MALTYPSIAQIQAAGTRDHRKDYGDQIPSDLDDTKPVPVFAGVGFSAGTAPEYDYAYGNYPVALEDPDLPGNEDSYCFPGKVLDQEDEHLYYVDIYTDGLGAPPITRTVYQLQINTDDIIPYGTWVPVMINRNIFGSFDFTMQVPVWL